MRGPVDYSAPKSRRSNLGRELFTGYAYMKPNFALSLSFDGIRLLHRAQDGWALAGDVALDVEDLHGALYVLRQTAEELAPDGVATKLVIPNSQIRYLTVKTGDVDDAARWVAVRAALDGATPYAVDELAFDLASNGLETQVAAVAKETLNEAETFAAGHGFNPVSFVATPDGDDFPGEVFFGESSLVRAELGPGNWIERDTVRITEVGSARLPEPEVEQGPEAAPEPAPVEEAASEPPAPAEEAGPEIANISFRHRAFDETPAEFEGAPGVASAKVPQEDEGESDDEDPDAPKPSFARGGFRVTNQRDAKEQATVEPETPSKASTPGLGFASRRNPETPPKLGGVKRQIIRPETAPETSSVAAPGILDDDEALTTAPVAEPAGAASVAAETLHAAPEPENPELGFLKSQSNAAAGAVSLNEAERLTVFGARGGNGAAGRSRTLGLLIAAMVIILLAGVAAWATVFIDNGLASLLRSRAAPEPEIASAPAADPIALPAPITLPASQPLAQRPTLSQPEDDAEPVVDLASLDPGLTDSDAAVLEALRDKQFEPVQESEPQPVALEPGLAVWSDAPLSPNPTALLGLDDLYEPGIDRSAQTRESHDALALPTLASLQTDSLILSPSPPAAAGNSFKLDARGLVIPSPEGTINPDGIMIYSGLPPIVPEAYPDRSNRAEPVPVDPVIAALAQARPRLRPSSLVEDTERANLGGLSRQELAAFRPVLRPQLERTPEEEKAEEPDSLPTAQAVRVSLRPDTRPKNFNRIVARAEPAPKPVTTIAPRTVAPKIPTSASVTREATVRNAINLSRINLIGVYGTPSQRRALVRLANGRYQKVKVGDRLDGGQVSAIGESELRYQKRGRNVVLKMPRS